MKDYILENKCITFIPTTDPAAFWTKLKHVVFLDDKERLTNTMNEAVKPYLMEENNESVLFVNILEAVSDQKYDNEVKYIMGALCFEGILGRPFSILLFPTVSEREYTDEFRATLRIGDEGCRIADQGYENAEEDKNTIALFPIGQFEELFKHVHDYVQSSISKTHQEAKQRLIVAINGKICINRVSDFSGECKTNLLNENEAIH